VTRNVDSEAAKALTDLGAEMVVGDFTNPQSLEAAAVGADTIFAMTTPFEGGIEAETAQGITLVDAAVAAGVGHYIFTSVASADKDTGIPHFDSKYEVEKHLAKTSLSWTVIAPVYFMENLFLPQVLDGLRQGTYAAPLPADLPLQQVAVDDIGMFGAHIVENSDAFAGHRLDIAGDELTSARSAEILGKVLEKPVAHFEVPMDQIRAFSEDFAIMYEWFISTGYTVDIEGLRSKYPDVGWHRFGEWASKAVPAAI
jgi:uncharacterized protein YbjT (DUF2867 family)